MNNAKGSNSPIISLMNRRFGGVRLELGSASRMSHPVCALLMYTGGGRVPGGRELECKVGCAD